MSQPNVLIISDDGEFARAIMGRWQSERSVPAFTLMSSDWTGGGLENCQLAVVGPLNEGRVDVILNALDTPERPTIIVLPTGASAKGLRAKRPRVLAVSQHEESWTEAVVLIGSEGLKRVEMMRRLEELRSQAESAKKDATLGRYMLEMRHSFNNALTSVLGNAELLLLSPGELSAQVRDQVDTIHSMTLRMHEIMQRFSSLESEMKFAEKESHRETRQKSHGVLAG